MLGKSEDDFDASGEVGGVSGDTILLMGVRYEYCTLAFRASSVGETGGELKVRSRRGGLLGLTVGKVGWSAS